MTIAVGHRNVASAAAGAVFLLGCFAVGVLTVRTSMALMLIYALGCLIIYLTKPQGMVWIALFLAFASLPAALHRSKDIGPVGIYDYQVAILLAIVFLIPLARLRFSAYVVPGGFLLTVAFFAAAGVAGGSDPVATAREAMFLCDLVTGFVLALLIVRTNYVRESLRVLAVVLWFSAGMMLASSLTGLRLEGRAESLQAETGSAQAIRLLTQTQTPALAVLAALVAAQILGRGRLSTHLALGVPALVITLLGFSRSTLIVLAVAAGVAFVASLGWSTVRRSAMLAVVAAALVGVVVPGALFILQHSAGGAWLADQLNAFSHRVIGGVSENRLAVDQSALDRLHEDTNLWRAITDAPVLGHGLGYAYQLPFGKSGTFTATLGPTYAHNFYLWWLAKAGAVGMASFAVLALTPVVRGVRSASVEAKISAAVSAALLAVCVVSPLPLEAGDSLALGMMLGAAMAFARPRQHAEQVEPSGSIADPVAVPSS